jgi:hemerythrin-like domain-containing protein
MLPIAPLMIEHRLIDRMIRLMGQDIARIRDNLAVDRDFAFVDGKFIDYAVDFMRTYADQVHHGKEEDILFTRLSKKSLSPEHLQTMQELLDDHRRGRQMVAALLTAKNEYLSGKIEALNQVLENLASLVEFYPKHIVKEDQHFFLPVMEYFTQPEKDALLAQMVEFDQKFIHTKYQKILADWESCGCKCHL